MSKIKRQLIYKMTPRQVKAYVDTHPEEGLRVAFILIWITIKITIKNTLKRIGGMFHGKKR